MRRQADREPCYGFSSLNIEPTDEGLVWISLLEFFRILPTTF